MTYIFHSGQYTIYLCEQGYEDLWLFCKPKGGPRVKEVWKALVERIIFFFVNCEVAGGETFLCENSRTLEGNINGDR